MKVLARQLSECEVERSGTHGAIRKIRSGAPVQLGQLSYICHWKTERERGLQTERERESHKR